MERKSAQFQAVGGAVCWDGGQAANVMLTEPSRSGPDGRYSQSGAYESPGVTNLKRLLMGGPPPDCGRVDVRISAPPSD